MALKLSKIRNLRAARVLVFGKGEGHRPSQFNINVGKCMKRKGATPKGGGRYSTEFQKAFVECLIEAGANVSPETREKFGIGGVARGAKRSR